MEEQLQLESPPPVTNENQFMITHVHTFQKTKIMASGPITSWQMDGETMETVRDFTFLGSKITADGDCSHEIKRSLLLGRKLVTNLESILKSRDITLPTWVWKVVAEPQKTSGVLASGGEEFNPGPETRLDCSELLCNKVLLKYKGDRETFWHRHQKGAERVPPC